jgi:predicted protein tyrosine phosphatase
MFVCGKARMRSPTAAEIAPRLLGVTADLGGLSADADVVLDRDQLAAADIIAVMERPADAAEAAVRPRPARQAPPMPRRARPL